MIRLQYIQQGHDYKDEVIYQIDQPDSWPVPTYGDSVTLEDKNHYMLLRRHISYAKGVEPVVKIWVQEIKQPPTTTS